MLYNKIKDVNSLDFFSDHFIQDTKFLVISLSFSLTKLCCEFLTTEGVSEHFHRFPMESVETPPWRSQKPSGRAPGHPALSASA